MCGSLDGKIFQNIKDAPTLPQHYNCRCVLVPYLKMFKDFDAGRASMDGTVSNKVTYSDWLKSQDDATLKDILGKSRYDMYKNGAKIDTFVGNGRALTIKELNSKMGGVAKPDITKLSEHLLVRMQQRGVDVIDLENAIKKPLFTSDVREDGTYRIIGERATVGISAFTGNITTAWKTGKDKLKKYGAKNENT